jgi:hypothetical protein
MVSDPFVGPLSSWRRLRLDISVAPLWPAGCRPTLHARHLELGHSSGDEACQKTYPRVISSLVGGDAPSGRMNKCLKEPETGGICARLTNPAS